MVFPLHKHHQKKTKARPKERQKNRGTKNYLRSRSNREILKKYFCSSDQIFDQVNGTHNHGDIKNNTSGG
jgi:hypothetical protein